MKRLNVAGVNVKTAAVTGIIGALAVGLTIMGIRMLPTNAVTKPLKTAADIAK